VAAQYQRDDTRCRITIVLTGQGSTDEVIGLLDRQAKDGAWSYGVLYDGRASLSVPTPDDIRRVLLHVGTLTTKYGPRGPVAFVSATPQLSRMIKVYSKLGELTALQVHVFGTLAEANGWLDEFPGRPLSH
jgi:hypothetical protein